MGLNSNIRCAFSYFVNILILQLLIKQCWKPPKISFVSRFNLFHTVSLDEDGDLAKEVSKYTVSFKPSKTDFEMTVIGHKY